MPDSQTVTIVRKVPGGKLVRMEVTSATVAGPIERVKITGDFFLHPEETLERLRSAIESSPLPLDADALTARLERIMAEDNAEAIGFAPGDLVSMLAEALA